MLKGEKEKGEISGVWSESKVPVHTGIELLKTGQDRGGNPYKIKLEKCRTASFIKMFIP